MLLKSLSLTNVRSYENLSIDFPPGYLLFRGDVGSGKSTILMAIEFALFGLGSVKAESLISKKAQRCEVVLRFEVDETEYEVGRAITKKENRAFQDSGSSYLVQDGTREPLTPSDLKARVLEVLKFREPANPRALSRVYRYAVYTPQEEIKSILEDKGDREETIRKAFGMEDYKIATENASLVEGRLSGEMARLSGLFGRLDEDESRLSEVRLEADAIKDGLSGLQAEKIALDQERRRMDSEMSDLRGQIDELNRMQAEKDQAERDIANQNDHLERLRAAIKKDRDQMEAADGAIEECRRVALPTKKPRDDLENLRRAALERDRRTHIIRSQLDRCRADLEALRSGLDGKESPEMRKIVDGLEADVLADERALQQAEQAIRDAVGRMGEKTGEISMLAGSLDKASSLGSRCEYCDSALSPDYVDRLRNDRRARLDAARAVLAAMEQDKEQAEDGAQKTRHRLNENRNRLAARRKDLEAADKMPGLVRTAGSLEADLTALEAASAIRPEESFPALPGESAHEYLGRLLEALARHEAAVKRQDILLQQKAVLAERVQESAESCEACEEKIRTLRILAGGLAESLGRRDAVDQSVRSLQGDLDKIQASLLGVEKDISAKQVLLERLAEDAERLHGDILEAKKHRARHNLCGDHAEWLGEYFAPSLRKMEQEVMNTLRYDFNDFYAQWYSDLVEDPTKTSYIDERFGPVIQQDGYQQEFAYLSGGEKTSVALAYRLALNSTMRRQAETLRSNLLILDEPTDGFSKAQMAKVRTILESLQAEQVIMVSHEAELEGYVDHVFAVTKGEGVSTVRRLS